MPATKDLKPLRETKNSFISRNTMIAIPQGRLVKKKKKKQAQTHYFS